MVAKVGIQVDPKGSFKAAINRASKRTSDLTIPLKLITQSWYKTNKALFAFTTKGPFDDLSENYQKQKQKKHGFIYPILKASGKLERSLTEPSDSDTIASILNKKQLILGTKVTSLKGVPYPSLLNFGNPKTNLPARPYMVIGTGKGKWSKSLHIQRRLKLWIELLDNYVKNSFEKKGT